MFGKSIKAQFVVLGLLFSVFVAVVLFQMLYTQKLQEEEIQQLQRSHGVISSYLDIEENEKRITDKIRALALQQKSTVRSADTADIKNGVKDWYERLKEWKRGLSKWESDSHVDIQASVFDEKFLDRKKRQADAYIRAVDLCGAGNFKDAQHVLNIESGYLPTVHKTILSILDGVKIQVVNDRQIVKRFYLGTAFAVVLALVALVFVSSSIFRSISSKIKILQEGAKRMRRGDYSVSISVSAPAELSALAKSFNEMQTAIKSRDEKIRDDTEEIQKLNEALEQKVVDRNKTIIQQNIALQRKNEELEQILYAASHDLRTPLISIQGFSEELKSSCASVIAACAKSPPDNKTLKDTVGDISASLNYILKGSKRMELLLEGLLRLSRMGRESLQIKKINMGELIRNVCDGLGFQINECHAEIKAGSLHECMADQSQFEQVFTNLIGNAIKYRRPDDKCVIKIRSEKDADFTRYFVEDNGIGISPENIERIFHAFYRVDEETTPGEGLGLAIVARALDLHNGRASCQSEPGKGSVFIIEVPNTPVDFAAQAK